MSRPEAETPCFTKRPLPPYRHLPGVTPHPVRDPAGHLFRKTAPPPEPFQPPLWRQCGDYLYGIDLFNHGFYWEAHESWEGIWKLTSKQQLQGLFLQALIQLAAAVLKQRLRCPRGTVRLAQKALQKFEQVQVRHELYAGFLVDALAAAARKLSADPSSPPPQLRPEYDLAFLSQS